MRLLSGISSLAKPFTLAVQCGCTVNNIFETNKATNCGITCVQHGRQRHASCETVHGHASSQTVLKQSRSYTVHVGQVLSAPFKSNVQHKHVQHVGTCSLQLLLCSPGKPILRPATATYMNHAKGSNDPALAPNALLTASRQHRRSAVVCLLPES